LVFGAPPGSPEVAAAVDADALPSARLRPQTDLFSLGLVCLWALNQAVERHRRYSLPKLATHLPPAEAVACLCDPQLQEQLTTAVSELAAVLPAQQEPLMQLIGTLLRVEAGERSAAEALLLSDALLPQPPLSVAL